ncbi:MAG: trypsin-like peptidase domain-containing protein [Gilvibacter sp.]
MKKTLQFLAIALVAGAITLGGYKYFFEKTQPSLAFQNEVIPMVNTNYTSPAANTGIDFTTAAENSVNAVVHVKNTTISKGPSNIMEYFYGGSGGQKMVGTGSGVIISADGYIVTNNHVIANAAALEVTLNNNKTYTATLIGTDPKTDIALIKIEADDDLAYMTFADSNEVKVGEWVLAVGNPFNLTSTVTAGIVSAKARDLNEFDNQPQSFIQTDAAVNRGNSGGALVNTDGQLIGINTAITSQTGSYVGYSFAVPSNNARKIIQDILEYGDVQRGILGIRGVNVDRVAEEDDSVTETEGVYVGFVEKGSGADKGGIKEGDIIKELDGVTINKFTDLVGYVGSKRPQDVVNVTILRDNDRKVIPVTLIKLETFELEDVGLEVRNASKTKLGDLGVDYGVEISRALTRDMQRTQLTGLVITKINDNKVTNIDDVKRVMRQRDTEEPIKITLVDAAGNVNNFIFR